MKQQLSEALEELSNRPGAPWAEVDPSIAEAIAAARLVERLLPERCTCVAGYADIIADVRCSVCHGYARVWDEGIVEAVAAAIYEAVYPGREMDKPKTRDFYNSEARAVLTAIAELLTEKVE